MVRLEIPVADEAGSRNGSFIADRDTGDRAFITIADSVAILIVDSQKKVRPPRKLSGLPELYFTHIGSPLNELLPNSDLAQEGHKAHKG